MSLECKIRVSALALAAVFAAAPMIAGAQSGAKPKQVKTFKDSGCFDKGSDLSEDEVKNALVVESENASCVKIVTTDQKTYYMLATSVKPGPCTIRPNNNGPTARTMGSRGAQDCPH